MKISDSLLAVPLPMEMTVTLCFLMRRSSSAAALGVILGRRAFHRQFALVVQQLAQRLAEFRIVRNALGDDVLGARDGVGGRLHPLFRVDVLRGQRRNVVARPLCLNDVGERFQPALDSDGRARLFLLLVRAVNVLHFGHRGGRFQRGGQFVRPLALPLNRGAHFLLAL